jgi:hypothetical protein
MKSTRKKSSKRRGGSKNRRWSALQNKATRWIALSLKRSSQASKRRKGTPYQSAMSMLNFYDAGRSVS